MADQPQDPFELYRRMWGSLGVPIYAAATLVSFVQPLAALALYAAIAALYAVTSQGWSDPGRRSATSPEAIE